jgi:hypothetical protein
MIQVESGGDPKIVSHAGAMGLMQLMPGTADGLGVTDPFDPQQNIMGGARYIKTMIDRYGGDLNTALAAYNWGPGNVDKKGLANMPTETRNYVRLLGTGGGRLDADVTPRKSRAPMGLSLTAATQGQTKPMTPDQAAAAGAQCGPGGCPSPQAQMTYGGGGMPQSMIPINNARQATPAQLPTYMPSTEQQQGGVFSSGMNPLGMGLMALGTILSGLSKDPRAADRNQQAMQSVMAMRQQQMRNQQAAEQQRLNQILGAVKMIPPGSAVPPQLIAQLPPAYQQAILANGGVMPGIDPYTKMQMQEQMWMNRFGMQDQSANQRMLMQNQAALDRLGVTNQNAINRMVMQNQLNMQNAITAADRQRQRDYGPGISTTTPTPPAQIQPQPQAAQPTPVAPMQGAQTPVTPQPKPTIKLRFEDLK